MSFFSWNGIFIFDLLEINAKKFFNSEIGADLVLTVFHKSQLVATHSKKAIKIRLTESNRRTLLVHNKKRRWDGMGLLWLFKNLFSQKKMAVFLKKESLKTHQQVFGLVYYRSWWNVQISFFRHKIDNMAFFSSLFFQKRVSGPYDERYVFYYWMFCNLILAEQ